MNKREQILDFLSKNKFKFEKDLNITKIGLFGSFASDKNNENSDIDLIVEFKPNTEMLFEKKIILKDLLKKQFSAEVDICREKYIKNYFREEIIKSAIYV